MGGALTNGRPAVELADASGWFNYQTMTRLALGEAPAEAGEIDAAEARIAEVGGVWSVMAGAAGSKQ